MAAGIRRAWRRSRSRHILHGDRGRPSWVVHLDQEAIDRRLVELDGTPNKARLGGNATVAVSMAALHAAAAARGEPLWRHLAGPAEPEIADADDSDLRRRRACARRVDIQDFLILPIGASTFDEALAMAAQVYESAGHHGRPWRACAALPMRVAGGRSFHRTERRSTPWWRRLSAPPQARDRRGHRDRRCRVAALERIALPP